MTVAQTLIIQTLKLNPGKPMTMKDINTNAKTTDENKLYPASATSLVRKGLICKVEGASPVQYYVDENLDMGARVIEFLSNESVQYSSLENMNKHLGDVEDVVKELLNSGQLVYNEDFKIYSVSKGE